MKFKKAIVFMLIGILAIGGLNAQTVNDAFAIPADVSVKTLTYATKDGNELKMDVYQKKDYTGAPQPVMFYMFAGGFFAGQRTGVDVCYYLGKLAERGITSISIDYRLGWKGAFDGKSEDISIIEKALDVLQDTKLMQKTFDMPVEDLYTATNYVISCAKELNIDPTKIIISGSSAGAMSVLRAEYFLKSGNALAKVLPKNFSYKGVLSFAGAIYSTQGMPQYDSEPAPTLFVHGTKDLVVSYKGLRFLKEGIFSSKMLAKEYKKKNYPYVFLSLRGAGHGEGAGASLINNFDDICQFIDDYVLGGKREPKEYTLKYDHKTAVYKTGNGEGDFSEMLNF